ncbi:MAG: pantothenate kinase [Cyanobacteria bacterium J06626_18]
MSAAPQTTPWLALVMGNTRLHWAIFMGNTLQGTWHTRHLHQAEVDTLIARRFAVAGWKPLTTMSVPKQLDDLEKNAAAGTIALYAASVVPPQLALWQAYPGLRVITLEQVPLANLYPTMGIDRALNLLGAGDRYGWPVLVIDAGTALTFTAGNADQFLGGAIVPGLALQFKALQDYTANLPQVTSGAELPSRWAQTTPEAIQSGVVHGVVAIAEDFLANWHRQYPEAPVVLTGGDGDRLLTWLNTKKRPNGSWHRDADLMFLGMCRCYLLETTDA